MASKKNNYKHKLPTSSKTAAQSMKIQKRHKTVDELKNNMDEENCRNVEVSPSIISSDYKENIFNIINGNWLDSKRATDKNFVKNLSNITSVLESDLFGLKSNLNDIQETITLSLKDIQQTTSSLQEIVTTLTEFEASYKKDCNAEETEHQMELDQLKEDYDRDIQKMKDKLITATRKQSFEKMQRSLIQAMQSYN